MKKIFSKDEYRYLLFLTYLGEWMVNAYRVADDQRKEYRDVLDKILACAQQFGLDEYIDLDEETGMIVPSSLLEDEANEFIEEYHNDCFWRKLGEHLSQRDIRYLFGDKVEKQCRGSAFRNEMSNG